MIEKLTRRFITNLKVVTRLGVGMMPRLKLLFVLFWLPLQKRLNLSGSADFKVRLQKFGKSFKLHLGSGSDFTVLKEIFLNDQYNVSVTHPPKVIFDLGSNIGLSVIYFKLKFPEAKIYAFEPNPESFRKLKLNIGSLENILILNTAVLDKDGFQKFYPDTNVSMASSLIKRHEGQDFVEVPVRCLDTLLGDLKIDRIDLLKFDVEGSEARIFQNFSQLNRVSKLVGEIHLDLMGQSKDWFLSIFKDFKIKLRDISSNRFIMEASR